MVNVMNDFTSEQARDYVSQWLLDEHFVSGGRFCQGWCDWFVIGGRWSGILTEKPEAETAQRSNQYDLAGTEDDAMIVTPEVYEKHLKQFEGQYGESPAEWWDIEESEMSADFVGKKWVVVVDYHM